MRAEALITETLYLEENRFKKTLERGLRLLDEDWHAVIEVNLSAAFRLTRAALRGMVRRRHGRVICKR